MVSSEGIMAIGVDMEWKSFSLAAPGDARQSKPCRRGRTDSTRSRTTKFARQWARASHVAQSGRAWKQFHAVFDAQFRHKFPRRLNDLAKCSTTAVGFPSTQYSVLGTRALPPSPWLGRRLVVPHRRWRRAGRLEHRRTRLARDALENLPHLVRPVFRLSQRPYAAPGQHHRADERNGQLANGRALAEKTGELVLRRIAAVVRGTKMRLCFVETPERVTQECDEFLLRRDRIPRPCWTSPIPRNR